MSISQGFDYNQWAAVNLGRPGSSQSEDPATSESVVQDGTDQAVSTVAKVTLGVNPSIKGRGVIPGDTTVGGGLSLQNLTLLKDLPGGVPASIGKYFTLAWDWLLGKGTAEGGDASGGAESHADSGGGGGNAAASDGVSAPGPAFDSFQPELAEYGGKLMAFDPVDVSFSWLGELVPPETPAIAREEQAIGVAA